MRVTKVRGLISPARRRGQESSVSEPAWPQREDVSYWPAAEQRADTVSPFPMRRSLSKIEIIRRRQDIDCIFKHGRKVSCKGMRLMILENTLGFDRFIVIPARKYGNSVQRNRIKRPLVAILPW